jgi:hypothetical protein
MTTVRLAGLDSSSGIEQFYEQAVAALAKCDWSDRLILDLSRVVFVRPHGLIALVTIARLWHAKTGCRVELVDIRPDVHAYLERMDLFARCGPWLEVCEPLADDARFDRSPASPNLLEVLPIASDEEVNASDVAEALERVGLIVDTWFDADASAVGRLLTMLSEIATNVVHSRDRGFATIQRYRRGPSHRSSLVAFAVGDLGIGIEASLRRRPGRPLDPGLHTGSDYIHHALRLGVTSRGSIGGMGLYQVQKLVEEWNGVLIIRSRRSVVRAGADGIRTYDGLTDIPGTQVAVFVQGSTGGLQWQGMQ